MMTRLETSSAAPSRSRGSTRRRRARLLLPALVPALVVAPVLAAGGVGLAQAQGVITPNRIEQAPGWGAAVPDLGQRGTIGTQGTPSGPAAGHDPQDLTAAYRQVPVGELLSRPQAYANQRLVTSGTIGRWLGTYAFEIQGAGNQTGRPLLVVSPTPLSVLPSFPNAAFDNSPVIVRGSIRPFNRRAIETDLGIDLTDLRLDRFRRQPVFVVTAIDLGRGFASVVPAGPTGGSAPPPPTRSRAEAPATFGTPAGQPQTLDVTGTVASPISRHAFTVQIPGLARDILVISRTPVGQLQSGDQLPLRGVVRQFDLPTIEQSTGVNLPDRLLDRFTGQTAIVIEGVR